MFLGAAVANALANFFERGGHDGIDAVARREVRLDLCLRPGGLELRDEIRGTDDVFSQAPQQVDSAAIHQRNGEDAVVGRVLHGEVAVLCQDGFELIE